MKVTLDAAKLVRKGPAHDYLAESFDFPEYYGRNLDALYDCISDISDLQIEIINAEKAFGYYEKVVEVLKDACENIEIK